jgi:hypothetical protein
VEVPQLEDHVRRGPRHHKDHVGLEIDLVRSRMQSKSLPAWPELSSRRSLTKRSGIPW